MGEAGCRAGGGVLALEYGVGGGKGSSEENDDGETHIVFGWGKRSKQVLFAGGKVELKSGWGR